MRFKTDLIAERGAIVDARGLAVADLERTCLRTIKHACNLQALAAVRSRRNHL